MIDSLGVTKDVYDNLVKLCGIKGIYNYLSTYGEGRISLYYYVDDKGSFLKPKRLSDHIAKSIYETLDSKEKMHVLEYENYIGELDAVNN